MRTLLKSLVVAVALVVSTVATAFAQIVEIPGHNSINSDSLRRAYDRQPYFGLYKDNYFIFGSSIGPKPTRENSNVKFQLSIAQRLTKSTLPWNTHLYLFYTQKCIWNVLEKSFPMRDLNFNPGIGLRKPLFSNGRYIGNATLILEHESNGRDSTASRSWNRVSVSTNIYLDPSVMIHGKLWFPFIDGENNPDLLRYIGVIQGGFSWISPKRNWIVSCILNKRWGLNLSVNTTIEVSFKPWKRDNQYFFAQFYNGYGECLLDYKTFRSQLRIGFVIKPAFFSDF